MASNKTKFSKQKQNSSRRKQSRFFKLSNFLKGHRLATVFVVFALIGGLAVVYRAFAVTDMIPQTNAWEYNYNNGRIKLGAEGICNFTTKYVAVPGGRVASIKCDVRDEGFRDKAWVDATGVQLGTWSAGKYYQACYWVAPDTPVGVWAKQRNAVASFRIDMLQGEQWGDAREFSIGYDTKSRFTYREFCTFRMKTDGTPRNLQLRIWSVNDSSFRLKSIVLKEFTQTPEQVARDKNPQPAPQTVAPPPSK